MRRSLIILICLFPGTGFLFSQEKRAITLNGYVTVMQSSMFDSLSGPFLNENVVHNRLNFKAFLNDNITAAVELRNRLFTGDMVRMGRYYSDMIGADPGLFDFSWNIAEKQAFLLNTTLDRLWIDFQYEKFQVTVGRQRINWGQTFVWNPNDIFNAYSFFDFDYVEKPGSDAVRLQYFTSSSSAAEMAVNTDNNNDITAAGLYRFNRWGYDIQFLTGIVKSNDIVVGAGWSGAIKNLAFRGEASWFDSYKKSQEGKSTLLVTSSLERTFKDNSLIMVQLMYCNRPLELSSFTGFYSGTLSAKDLAFSKLTAFGQFTWAATPLLNIGTSAMWFPDLKGYFAGPTLDYSLAENLDFSLYWQHFNALMTDIRTNINIVFIRLKYNF
ncbi:MAG TPA: hypothetical protein PKH02_07235 [Bacteroidales bacterium]|nr:hypothetical protein [Bacteroidales bacterium]